MATKGAPMPQKEEEISKNSMKLYTFLVCLSGLALYPQNTRMFRQKNLILTQIQKTIGISPETIKLYLYYLEKNDLIRYQGQYQFTFLKQKENESKPDYRKRCMKQVREVWTTRSKKEKEGVYHIPRPFPFIPIPEQTLELLNKEFQCSELEMKLYLLCCSYHSSIEQKAAAGSNIRFKCIKFEDIRDAFELKNSGSTVNREIRMALMFLKAINLIDFVEGRVENHKKFPIPVFKLLKVNYYIDYKVEDFVYEDIISKEDFNEIVQRIKFDS